MGLQQGLRQVSSPQRRGAAEACAVQCQPHGPSMGENCRAPKVKPSWLGCNVLSSMGVLVAAAAALAVLVRLAMLVLVPAAATGAAAAAVAAAAAMCVRLCAEVAAAVVAGGVVEEGGAAAQAQQVKHLQWGGPVQNGSESI